MSSQLRHVSTIGKKLVKQQYVLHMSQQCGELRPTSGWDRLTSLGYPCKFQLVSRLGSVTTRHLLVGTSQTLRRWIEGATYIRQGDHHVGHWPTFLVFCGSSLHMFWDYFLEQTKVFYTVLCNVRLLTACDVMTTLWHYGNVYICAFCPFRLWGTSIHLVRWFINKFH